MLIDDRFIEEALVCEGIVGDGCGGGRLFYIHGSKLFAYDPYAKTRTLLLEDIQNAISLKKEGCLLYIGLPQDNLVFDLSTFKVSA
jgi:hypothetical protein